MSPEPLSADDPSPGEEATAGVCIQLVIDAGFCDESGALTWSGLHALPALVTMFDGLVEALILDGQDAPARVGDVASRAFTVIRLLDEDDGLQRRLLGGTS